ncbi:MAG: SAP domain-containing protein [Candidatus Fimisoma sp.]
MKTNFFSRMFNRKDDEPQVPSIDVKVTSQSHNGAFDPDIPPLQGDYAKTIFLWAHEKASAVHKDDEYARYFLYECGIRRASMYHRELISQGYFDPASTTDMLSSLRVADLKQALSELGQPVSGKKDALISRIIETGDTATIRKLCPEEMYVLSEKGHAFLQEHNDYVLVHKHKNWEIDWHEYDANHRPGFSFYDTVWGILNERVLKDNQNYGRNAYLCMYQLLAEEGKRERAIELLLRVLYIDLSGVFAMRSYQMYREGFYTKKELRDHFDIAIMLAPGIIHPIKDYKDVYNDSMVDHLYEQKLPVQVCEKKMFLSIVHSILDGTYDETSVVEQLRNAYNRMIKSL